MGKDGAGGYGVYDEDDKEKRRCSMSTSENYRTVEKNEQFEKKKALDLLASIEKDCDDRESILDFFEEELSDTRKTEFERAILNRALKLYRLKRGIKE